MLRVLQGSWDLVTRVIIRATILFTPIKVLITLLTKFHDLPGKGRHIYQYYFGGFLIVSRV